MNIFVLDKDPREAARMLCDKHVPKMIVESGQMLSTAHRMLDGTQSNVQVNLVKQYKHITRLVMNVIIFIILQYISIDMYNMDYAIKSKL